MGKSKTPKMTAAEQPPKQGKVAKTDKKYVVIADFDAAAKSLGRGRADMPYNVILFNRLCDNDEALGLRIKAQRVPHRHEQLRWETKIKVDGLRHLAERSEEYEFALRQARIGPVGMQIVEQVLELHEPSQGGEESDG